MSEKPDESVCASCGNEVEAGETHVWSDENECCRIYGGFLA